MPSYTSEFRESVVRSVLSKKYRDAADRAPACWQVFKSRLPSKRYPESCISFYARDFRFLEGIARGIPYL